MSSQRPKIQTQLANDFATQGTPSHERLRRILTHRLLWHAPEVDDLAQEVYQRILRIPDADKINDLMAYVTRIAVNVVSEHWREWDNGVTVSLEDIDLQSEQLGVAPDINIEIAVRQALEQLRPIEATVVLLVKCEGFTYAEAAEHLNISEHMVHKYFKIAMMKLRAMPWEG